jgi:CHAD domain-containing protein
MRLDPELLDGPPGATARVVTLARCTDVDEAATRLADPQDAEALHDLRVALRRLRSTLRALAPLLGDAQGRRAPRRLRRAARLTGPARDAEVLLAWLREVREQLQAPHRGALDWLTERVERRLARERAEVEALALPRLGRVTARLCRRLAAPAREPSGAAASFAGALAALLRARIVALREALRAVVGAEDTAGIHRVRIEGKRLRYLLEPLRGVPGADASEAVAALKELQEDVGQWHDAAQARVALASAVTEAAAERARWRGKGAPDADLRPGLLALARLAQMREASWYERLERDYLDGRATPLLDRAYAVVAALEARAAGEAGEPGSEAPPAAGPERRLLLTALPPGAEAGEVEEHELGWLPGDRARECVGTVHSAAGEQHFRAVAARRPDRPPRVEPLSRADFEAFWPLTEGRRVLKRCRAVPGTAGWRLDEHLDRKLVLAVGAPGAGEPPAWLEPFLVRDVTGERGYADEALARRPVRRRAAGEDGPGQPAGDAGSQAGTPG